MKLMRRLKVASLKFNIHFHSEQIPGLYNTAPDLMLAYKYRDSKELFLYVEIEEILVAHALLHL